MGHPKLLKNHLIVMYMELRSCFEEATLCKFISLDSGPHSKINLRNQHILNNSAPILMLLHPSGINYIT